MPTYVSLINWTDEGIKNFRDTTKRAKNFTKLVGANGGKVRELLWTIGECDLVAVVEFPEDESSVATLLQLCSLGSVRTRTMRAFGAKDMEGIISRTG
ncbi:MAG TPA: GYD domain-containing protein [Acidimicrobiales bacterium]|nr:GYD domain-containing protein [Acidimicrobiales bacterium]